MEKGRIVIFAAGTGSPFFTTDTTAALRAAEMNCDALFKGTSVDGIYNADPKQVPDAARYEEISFDRVLNDNLKVMDASAIALCRENNIHIVVFNIPEIGRASCRARVCQYVYISVVAVSLQQQNHKKQHTYQCKSQTQY